MFKHNNSTNKIIIYKNHAKRYANVTCSCALNYNKTVTNGCNFLNDNNRVTIFINN